MRFSPSNILLLVVLFSFRCVQTGQTTRKVSLLLFPLHLNGRWSTFGYSLLVTCTAPIQNCSGDPAHCCLSQFIRAWLLLRPLTGAYSFPPTLQDGKRLHGACHCSESGEGRPDHHWSSWELRKLQLWLLLQLKQAISFSLRHGNPK